MHGSSTVMTNGKLARRPTMETYDDDLRKFEADGGAALVADEQGYVSRTARRFGTPHSAPARP
jgi:hypothetical protein